VCTVASKSISFPKMERFVNSTYAHGLHSVLLSAYVKKGYYAGNASIVNCIRMSYRASAIDFCAMSALLLINLRRTMDGLRATAIRDCNKWNKCNKCNKCNK